MGYLESGKRGDTLNETQATDYSIIANRIQRGKIVAGRLSDNQLADLRIAALTTLYMTMMRELHGAEVAEAFEQDMQRQRDSNSEAGYVLSVLHLATEFPVYLTLVELCAVVVDEITERGM